MQCLSGLSNEPGTYILLVKVNNDVRVNVGKLGEFTFPRGHYAYVGSAGLGLARRVCRHIRLANVKRGSLRWHIDYLLNSEHAFIECIIVIEGRLIEHEAALALLNLDGVSIAVPRFGASDCHCPTHLFRVNDASSFINSLRNLCRMWGLNFKVSFIKH